MIKRTQFYVGIDIGTNTGYAVYDSHLKKFISIQTLKIHEAMEQVLLLAKENENRIMVRFENVKSWRPFGKNREPASARIQGAGSIKRDQSIWEDYLTEHHIPYELVGLTQCRKKTTAAEFKQITGWDSKVSPTTEHSRDSAMMVYGF